MTAVKLTAEEIHLLELRNPQVDFRGETNLAVQTGNKTIPQMIEDFRRAGRAIQVARADQVFPETEGLPLYPDKIETELLKREVKADLLIARKRVEEEQKAQQDQLNEKNQKKLEDLEKIQAAREAAGEAPKPQPEAPKTATE